MRYPILALALSAPLAACSPAATNNTSAARDADVAAVKAVEAKLLAAFKAKDAAKVAAIYTADADVMTPFAAVASGADVEKTNAEQLKDPAFAIHFTNTRTEVSSDSDMAFTRGTFSVTYTNPATQKPGTIKGNYVTVFRKQADGRWKAVQDISTPGPS